MKALLVLLGILTAGATFALGFRAVRQHDVHIAAGAKAMQAEELHKRYVAVLESDRLERDTEQLLWNAQLGLTQQRELVAEELDEDQAVETPSPAKNNLSDAGIALERAALARIDARLLALRNEARTLQDQKAHP